MSLYRGCLSQGCKQQFHVTCAQGLGLLCEEAGNYLDNVKYCGYCQHHYSKLVSSQCLFYISLSVCLCPLELSNICNKVIIEILSHRAAPDEAMVQLNYFLCSLNIWYGANIMSKQYNVCMFVVMCALGRLAPQIT